MTDPRLVVAWLLLLHLVAEYVLRPEPGRGRPAAASLGVHGIVVAVCFAPVVIAFGAPGAVVAAAAVIAHVVIDGLEPVGRPTSEAKRDPDGTALSDLSLGPEWTIRPAARAVLAQGLHVGVLLAAWRIFVAGASPTQLVADVARNAAGDAPADFHRAVLIAVVVAAVLIVDIVAAARFVGLLLRPWGRPTAPAGRAVVARPVGGPEAASARSWWIRLGPLTGSVTEDPPAAHPETPPAPGGGTTSPATVGRAIGVFERLLITMLVLAQAEAAVALVVGVKTIARYRQLDDRSFAEYYLLGTLASVLIGIGAGLAARLVLA